MRSLGSRADAATIAPLALAAWPDLARSTTAEPSTRTWSLAVSLTGRRVDELIAIAKAKADPGRLAAIAALGRLGGDAAREALTAIHANATEDDAIKLAAWKALRRLARRDAKVYTEGQDKGPRGAAAAGAASEEEGAAAGDENADDDDGDGDGDGDDGDDEDAGDDDAGDDDDGGDDDGGDGGEGEDEDEESDDE